MLVMKFGGASVNKPEAVRNVCNVIRMYVPQSELLVVVSAMDKTTNHLEKLAGLARDCREEQTWKQFRSIRDFHHEILDDLFSESDTEVRQKVGVYFNQVERIIRGILLLGEFPERTYDRIVAFGELLSTTILSHYLNQEGVNTKWVDARELIKTDASHTQAAVIWTLTMENIKKEVKPLLKSHDLVVTQGFIASSIEGKVTTLGREGSDYTASIFAYCLGAESVTVWKDVKGILNGDPRIETNTIKLDTLSYERAVEMTFFGASVIHPKTIKPLRNAGIPLLVKCFSDTTEPGTVIGPAKDLPAQTEVCSRIQKKNQVLLTIKPLDFSFMNEIVLGRIFAQVARAGVQINLIQISAISLTLCATHNPAKIGEFESLLMDNYVLERKEDMVLKTFINYGEEEFKASFQAELCQFADGKLFMVLRDGSLGK